MDSVLTSQGWIRDATITVCGQGVIEALAADSKGAATAAGSEHIAGTVIPGMPNAHSHAFQRAMAGGSEARLSNRDSFWSWRQHVSPRQ
jgi:formimidoylglutamate deiminase